MSRKWWVVAVLVFAVALQGQDAEFNFRQASDDAGVRSVFATFMKFSGNRTDDIEHAAFLVRDEDGTLSCVQWPYANWERASSYQGVVPEGTVAILRVQSWRSPRPSAADIRQSVTSGLPVYTLTRRQIYAVDPASGETVQIASNDWSGGVTATKAGRCRLMKNWRPTNTPRTVPVREAAAVTPRRP